jgi:hypothetical protein
MDPFSSSRPFPVSWGPNHIDVFWRGMDEALWHRWFVDETWYGPKSLGAALLALGKSGADVRVVPNGALDSIPAGQDVF